MQSTISERSYASRSRRLLALYQVLHFRCLQAISSVVKSSYNRMVKSIITLWYGQLEKCLQWLVSPSRSFVIFKGVEAGGESGNGYL